MKDPILLTYQQYFDIQSLLKWGFQNVIVNLLTENHFYSQ